MVLNNLELNNTSTKFCLSACPLIQTSLLVESHLRSSSGIPCILHSKQNSWRTTHCIGVFFFSTWDSQLIGLEVVAREVLIDDSLVFVNKLGVEPVALEAIGNIARDLGYHCNGLLGVLLSDSPSVAIVRQSGVDNQVFATEGEWEAAIGSALVGKGESSANEAVLSLVHNQVNSVSIACPQHVVLGAVGSNVGVNYGRAGWSKSSALNWEQSDVVDIDFATQEWHLEDAGRLGCNEPEDTAIFLVHHVALDEAEEVATAILGLKVGEDVSLNINGVTTASGEDLHDSSVGHEVAWPAVVNASNDVASIVASHCRPRSGGASCESVLKGSIFGIVEIDLAKHLVHNDELASHTEALTVVHAVGRNISSASYLSKCELLCTYRQYSKESCKK